MSSGDYNCEISDLSDWLRGPECREVKDPNNLPNGLMKQTTLTIFGAHKWVGWDSIYPIYEDLATQNPQNRVELADLLITTTLLAPLIRGIWKEGANDLGNKDGSDLDTETITQIVLFWGANCVMTIDLEMAGLIKSATHIASKLGIFWEKPKRRKFPNDLGGALDPTMRAICPNFNATGPKLLLDAIRADPPPLPEVAGRLAKLRRVLRSAEGPSHALLWESLRRMFLTFREGKFTIRTRIVGNYDVIWPEIKNGQFLRAKYKICVADTMGHYNPHPSHRKGGEGD